MPCARKFDCLLVWKLDRFGRSLVDCLNKIRTLEDIVSGSLPSPRTWIPISRTRRPGSCYACWARAAEFERALIRGRSQAGRLRYKQDYEAGRVGNGVYSRSGGTLLLNSIL